MISKKLGKDVVVHTHASGEGGIFANAYLVEGQRSVIAVDATLSETESKNFRKELEALRKPLEAVLITHPHPDHVAGITNLVGSDNPKIVATQAVLDLMRKLEEPKRKQWGPVYGAEWVARWTYPNTVVESGERITCGNLTFSVLDIGAGGDSEANSVWFLDSPARAAFLSDLTFNGTHSYVADGNLLAWLANLTRLEEACTDWDTAFPGHGPSGSPGELISRQRGYLLTLAAHVKELAQNRTQLSDEAKKELEKRMTDYLPGAGLSFLISMNADPIARELNAKKS